MIVKITSDLLKAFDRHFGSKSLNTLIKEFAITCDTVLHHGIVLFPLAKWLTYTTVFSEMTHQKYLRNLTLSIIIRF